MFYKFFLLFIHLTYFTVTISFGQELVVVAIQGTVKVGNLEDAVNTYQNLNYGLLHADQVLILEKNSKVKIIHLNGSVWEFKHPGRYLVSSIKGVNGGFEGKINKDGFSDKSNKVDDKSTLSQFGDYFLSFFEHHGSSESKESYKNSVYAISRGEPSIILEFPFSGLYPAEHKSIQFSWAHACDTCTYELTIYKDKSKSIVFNTQTNSKNFTLKQPSKYFANEKSLIWNVTTKTAPENHYYNRLTFSESNDYKKVISKLEKDVNKHLPDLGYAPRAILILSSLQNSEKINYAYLYSQQLRAKHKTDKALRDFTDRFFYDELKKKLAD